MIIYRILLAVAGIAVTTSSLFSQGLISGFMQGAGRTSVAVSASTEWFDRYYVANTLTDNPVLGTISTSSMSVYVASGITSFLDVVANLPYVRASSNAGFWSPIAGVQDVHIGLRGRPLSLYTGSGRLDVITAVVGFLPLTNYVTDVPVTIGHGASGMDFRLGAQYNAWSGVFISAQVAYVAKGTVTIDRGFDVDVPDAFDMVIRSGWGHAAWYADVWIQNTVAQSGTNIAAGVPFPSNAQSAVRTGATVAWRVLDKLSFFAGMAGTIDGRNVGQTTRVSLGVGYDIPSWSGLSF